MKNMVCAFLMLLLAPLVSATELFPGGKPDLGQTTTMLPIGSTLSGYAIYQPDAAWRVSTLTTQATSAFGNADSITLGTVGLDHFDRNGEWDASMWIAANLNYTGRNQYVAGDPCGGKHLVSLNKGKGTQDNCMTIDAETAKVGTRQRTLLQVKIRQSQSAGRIYAVSLYLNVESLGFSGTSLADWTATAADSDPGRKAFVGRLKKWAELLQDATSKALDFNKPPTAFAAVPSFTSLGSTATDAPQ